MTDLDIRPTKTQSPNGLKRSLSLLLDLSPGRLAVLAAAIRSGKVSLPSGSPLLLPVVASQARIDGFERDIIELTPQGVAALRERLAKVEDTEKNRKTRARIQFKIDNASELLETAKADLATARARQAEREAAFRVWLRSGVVPKDWINPLVAALRSNVTYVNFMTTPTDTVGTLYVERD